MNLPLCFQALYRQFRVPGNRADWSSSDGGQILAMMYSIVVSFGMTCTIEKSSHNIRYPSMIPFIEAPNYHTCAIGNFFRVTNRLQQVSYTNQLACSK